MKIAYGKIVEDKNGNQLGQVNYVIRDSWTGEVRKFGIWNPDWEKDVLVPLEKIQKVTEEKIVLANDQGELS